MWKISAQSDEFEILAISAINCAVARRSELKVALFDSLDLRVLVFKGNLKSATLAQKLLFVHLVLQFCLNPYHT